MLQVLTCGLFISLIPGFATHFIILYWKYEFWEIWAQSRDNWYDKQNKNEMTTFSVMLRFHREQNLSLSPFHFRFMFCKANETSGHFLIIWYFFWNFEAITTFVLNEYYEIFIWKYHKMVHFGALFCKRFLVGSIYSSFDDVTNMNHD